MSPYRILELAILMAAVFNLLQPARAQQASGMVAVRDAQTGNMRAPTAAELRALASAPGATAAQGTPAAQSASVRADGTRSVKLGERGMVYSVVTRAPDGTLAEQCVHGAGAADHAVNTATPSTKGPGHEHQ